MPRTTSFPYKLSSNNAPITISHFIKSPSFWLRPIRTLYSFTFFRSRNAPPTRPRTEMMAM